MEVSERAHTPYLPLELWLAVFDMIVNDCYLWLYLDADVTKRITLHALCLTCSAWVPYVRAGLYRDIKIESTTQSQKLTRTLMHFRPKNAEYIETLEYMFPGEGQISSSILPPFGNFNLNVARSLRHLLPALEELSIDSFVEEKGPVSQFLRLVHAFPGIKKLKVMHVPPFTPPAQYTRVCKGKLGPSLCELEMQESGASDSSAFLSYLIQNTNTPHTLHTLHITVTRCISDAIQGLNDFLEVCGPTLKYLHLKAASGSWLPMSERTRNYVVDLQHNYKLGHLRLDLYRVFHDETLSWYLDILATVRAGNLVVELDKVEVEVDSTNTLEPALLNMNVSKLTVRAGLSPFVGQSKPRIWEMFPKIHKLGILEGHSMHALEETG
ncbi:unnamed protein product [Somion occarium]|uniref:F-box domain-containing protein n=1 Tax=Somion occarium TaxID=3059160 RepID=A0ABP1D898_9APHY